MTTYREPPRVPPRGPDSSAGVSSGASRTRTDQILDFVRRRGLDQRVQLADIVEHLGIDNSTGKVSAAVSTLVAGGKLLRVGRGVYMLPPEKGPNPDQGRTEVTLDPDDPDVVTIVLDAGSTVPDPIGGLPSWPEVDEAIDALIPPLAISLKRATLRRLAEILHPTIAEVLLAIEEDYGRFDNDDEDDNAC